MTENPKPLQRWHASSETDWWWSNMSKFANDRDNDDELQKHALYEQKPTHI